MIASEELRALAQALRSPAKKPGVFGRKRKNAVADTRLAAAHRFAELSGTATVDEQTLETLEHLASEFASDPAIKRAYALALATGGREPEAIAEFEECLRLQPEDAQVLAAVADLYERSGRNDLAIERLRRAVDICVAAMDLDAAVAAARRLISLEPQSLERAADLVSILRAREPALLAGAVEHLANVYRERGKLGQEAEACRELLALEPEREDVKRRLASLYTRVLEVDPDDTDAWVGLATVDEALAEQLRVILLREETSPPPEAKVAPEPGPSDAYARRKALELMAAGDMVGAGLCLERAVSTDGDPEDHLRLAQCYQATHREEAAAREGLRALAVAQTTSNFRVADEAQAWIAAVWPDRGDVVADAVFLNHRPKSADTLYELLLNLWKDAQDASGVGTASEAD